jgi:O-antigen ligase
VAAATASLAYMAGDRSGAAAVRRSRERVIVGALLAWALLTIPVSQWPGGSIKTLLDPFIQSLVLFWLVSALAVDAERLRTFVATLTWCSVPLALTALLHFADGQHMAAGERIEGYASGLAGNPNDLALMLVIILPLTAALLSLTRTPGMRMVLAGIVVLQASAIIATFSRSGFLALIIVLLAGLLRLVQRRSLGILAGLVAAMFLAFFLLPAGYSERLSTIGDINSDPTGSAQVRWADTLAAEDLLAQHPIIGAGLGLDYLALNDARGSQWKSVHNAYLQSGVDLGVLGLVLYVLLAGSSLVTAWRAERDAESRGMEDVLSIASGIRIALMAFVFAAFFYPIAYNAYLYLLSGLAVAARGATSRVEDS